VDDFVRSARNAAIISAVTANDSAWLKKLAPIEARIKVTELQTADHRIAQISHAQSTALDSHGESRDA